MSGDTGVKKGKWGNFTAFIRGFVVLMEGAADFHVGDFNDEAYTAVNSQGVLVAGLEMK